MTNFIFVHITMLTGAIIIYFLQFPVDSSKEWVTPTSISQTQE